MSTPAFKTTMEFAYGVPRELAPGVTRIVADNPGPYTFKGTNTYIVGTSTLAVIDPGPDDDHHLAAILKAVAGRPVSHIVVTHTHHDHIDLLPRLQDRLKAPTVGYGRADIPRPGASQGGRGSEDGHFGFRPDVAMREGDELSGPGWRLRALFTPGHAPDHLCFALEGRRILLSGDHVMSWSTSVVAPPGGNMAQYIASLERLVEGPFDLYFPGHGGQLPEPARMVKAMLVHRRWREDAILATIRSGRDTISEVAEVVYRGLDPRLATAARLSVQAHVEHLMSRGLVEAAGPLDFEQRVRAKG